jgi:menaquinone-9 beta-reductase
VEPKTVSPTHDAVVIGGGPAGTTAAILLAHAGWSVALIERKDFPRRKVCGEYLSATNLPLFDRLGIGEIFRDLAGPPVKQVGLFAGETMTQAELPRPAQRNGEWGRALSREHLDTWLLHHSRTAGVDTYQPWTVAALTRETGVNLVKAESIATGTTIELRSPVVIAAHGSWEPGHLPTHAARREPAPTDLLAFKGHFHNADLPAGLMPLLAFPGGYGGMVHCDLGRVSLSCCIRRDKLAGIRSSEFSAAGEAVFAHIEESCLGVRKALFGAHRDGPWLAAGPIRPGIRLPNLGGIFSVGNAAGESHPIIAEGISMAMQSAWLLCGLLIPWRRCSGNHCDLPQIGRRYAAAWRRAFARRVQASQILATWAMRPTWVAAASPLVTCFPSLMTWIARLTGKATPILGD